ncbi:MAG: site-specific integrase [Clostridia bacterium]
MSKRANGEGSISYIGSKGLYRASVTVGRDNEGKHIRKYIYAKKRKDVQDKMIKLLNDVNSHNFVQDNKITIVSLISEIIETKYKSNLVGHNTYGRSIGTLEHIINSDIATVPIQKATYTDIQNFLNTKIYLSNSYINKMYGMLTMVFKEAIKRNIISKDIMMYVVKPKSDKQDKQVKAFTVEEQKSILEMLQNNDSKYKNIILMSMFTGLRMGEVLALQTTDIDFKDDIIHINRTITKDSKGKSILGVTAKTYSGNRNIPITPTIKKLLSDIMSQMTSNEYNLLFTGKNDTIIRNTTLNNELKKICKDISSESVSFHMLRHTYATRCIESGMNATVLSKLLGHKDIETTLNTYTTVFNKFKNEELQKANDYMAKLELIL